MPSAQLLTRAPSTTHFPCHCSQRSWGADPQHSPPPGVQAEIPSQTHQPFLRTSPAPSLTPQAACSTAGHSQPPAPSPCPGYYPASFHSGFAFQGPALRDQSLGLKPLLPGTPTLLGDPSFTPQRLLSNGPQTLVPNLLPGPWLCLLPRARFPSPSLRDSVLPSAPLPQASPTPACLPPAARSRSPPVLPPASP